MAANATVTRPPMAAATPSRRALTLAALALAGCASPALPATSDRRVAVDVAPTSEITLPKSEPAPEASATSSASAAPVAPPPKKGEVVRVPEIDLELELPSDAWKQHPGLGTPPKGVTQIGWERDDVLDDAGHPVRPYCGITTEAVAPKDRDIIQYSLSWRLRAPFSVDAVFSHDDGTIQLASAIGYRGKTSYEGNEHGLTIVHGLRGARGFIVVCDTTTSVQAKVQGEIDALFRSMRFVDPKKPRG